MEAKTLGTTIAVLRKRAGMTQAELAAQMCVTDKAVSKWERDLSCPDIGALSKLAELFDVSVDELVQAKTAAGKREQQEDVASLVNIILKGIGLAMGVAVVALSALKQLDVNSAVGMLGIGLVCLGLAAFQETANERRNKQITRKGVCAQTDEGVFLGFDLRS